MNKILFLNKKLLKKKINNFFFHYFIHELKKSII